MDSNPIIVGRFGRPFGVFGWIKVISFTTPEGNILKLQPWLIKKNSKWEEMFFEGSKKHAGCAVVKLSAYNSPEEVSFFTNTEIGIWREQLPKLPDNEHYWAELLGLDVVNQDGVNFGKVTDFIATGSNDVLVVTGERRRLIPYLTHVVIDVNLSNKIIRVDWEAEF